MIVAPGANDTRAAKNATQTIPIVFTEAGSDPVTLGLVESLARPGGNVTGFTQIAIQLAGKRLELLKKPFPNSLGLRFSVIRRSRLEGDLGRKRRQAKALGLQLHSLRIKSVAEGEIGSKDGVKRERCPGRMFWCFARVASKTND